MNELEYLRKRNHELNNELESVKKSYAKGMEELAVAVDSILSAVVKKYGEEIKEDDKVIGWNAMIPKPNAAERYEIKVEKRECEYSIGVFNHGVNNV